MLWAWKDWRQELRSDDVAEHHKFGVQILGELTENKMLPFFEKGSDDQFDFKGVSSCPSIKMMKAADLRSLTAKPKRFGPAYEFSVA